VPEQPDRSAKDLLERFVAAYERDDDEALKAVIHPKARWHPVTGGGELLRGRDAILAAVRSWRSQTYRPTIHRLEALGKNTVLVGGRLRSELPGGGFADSPVVWIDEIRDGMIWRVQAYSSEEQARAAVNRRKKRRD